MRHHGAAAAPGARIANLGQKAPPVQGDVHLFRARTALMLHLQRAAACHRSLRRARGWLASMQEQREDVALGVRAVDAQLTPVHTARPLLPSGGIFAQPGAVEPHAVLLAVNQNVVDHDELINGLVNAAPLSWRSSSRLKT